MQLNAVRNLFNNNYGKQTTTQTLKKLPTLTHYFDYATCTHVFTKNLYKRIFML